MWDEVFRESTWDHLREIFHTKIINININAKYEL